MARPKKSEQGKPKLHRTVNHDRFKNAKCLVANMMMYGKSRDEIIDELIEHYEYGPDMAELTYREGEKRLQKKMSEMNITAAEKHSKMLNAIAEEAYDRGDLKICLQAIDLLNRTKHVYQDTIKLEAENFKIKLGE